MFESEISTLSMECEVCAILAEMNRTAHEQYGIVTGHDCARTKELSGPAETLYFARAEFNC